MRYRIMVIDSEKTIQVDLKHELDQYYDLVIIDNCSDAMSILLKQFLTIKIVLANVDTLRKNNYSIMGKMKNNPVLTQIPVIGIMEQEDDCFYINKAEREALSKGIIDFICLPCDAEILHLHINNLIHLRDNASFINSSFQQNTSVSNAVKKYEINPANGTFWNPRSIDALIFHSYIGAACILEKRENEISIIRTNDKFSKELFGLITPVEVVQSLDLLQYMDDENTSLFFELLDKATTETNDVDDSRVADGEVVLHNLREDQPNMHLHISLHVIDHVRERYLYYCSLENNTTQRESVRKERVLTRQLQFIMQNFSEGLMASYVRNDALEKSYSNDMFCTIFGYTKAEFETELSGQIIEAIMPEFRNHFRESIEEAIRGKKTTNLEMKAKKKDGTIIWIHCRNSVYQINQVNETILVSIISDITRQKEMENRICQINDRLGYAELYLQMNVSKSKIEEYRSLFEPERNIEPGHFSPISMLDRIMEYVYPEDKKLIKKTLSFSNMKQHFAEADSKYSIEFRRLLPNGEYHWFSATILLLEDYESNDVLAYIYCHDIHRRMQLRIAQRKVIDSEIENIIIINLLTETVQTLKIYQGSIFTAHENKYINNVRKLIRTKVAEEDKVRCTGLFSLKNIKKKIVECGSEDFSFWIVEKDGVNKRKNTHITYLDSTHESLLMVGRDITKLFEQETEKQLQLKRIADIAESANRAKSEFLSSMSHDMRTPLNAILGLTELQRKKEHTAETQEYLEQIEHTGKYLLSLVNDSLDLSKIESGKMELHKEAYPLDEFLHGIDIVIKPLMEAKKINFIMDLTKVHSNIVVDKLRFNQIFYNILSNAAKYTLPGGTVVFQSREIEPRGDKFGLRFIIRDTGIGMSPDYLKVLFDPFSQESRKTCSEQRGTGLGLTIVKRIVDLSGGNISVKSTLNQGTEFTIDLYALNKETFELSEEKKDYDPEKLRNLHVLLADDSEINAMISKSILANEGCIVDVTSNGQEAVEQFQNSKPRYYDIILMDVRMPIMDGLEATRRIRSMERSDAKTIPIIGATADVYTDIEDKTKSAGMNARLVKPMENNVLFSTMINLISQSTKN